MSDITTILDFKRPLISDIIGQIRKILKGVGAILKWAIKVLLPYGSKDGEQ